MSRLNLFLVFLIFIISCKSSNNKIHFHSDLDSSVVIEANDLMTENHIDSELIDFLNNPIDLIDFKSIKTTSNSGSRNRKKYHLKPDSINDFIYYLYSAFWADSTSEELLSPTKILVLKYGSGKNEWDDKNEMLIELRVFGSDIDLKSANIVGLPVDTILSRFGKGYQKWDSRLIYCVENNLLILNTLQDTIIDYRYLRLNTNKVDSLLIQEVLKDK